MNLLISTDAPYYAISPEEISLAIGLLEEMLSWWAAIPGRCTVKQWNDATDELQVYLGLQELQKAHARNR